ncbi:MAG: hypothetical protein CVV47_03700 [Spirochaetae bacterium HGW-Spirochaetae-3]|jgi:sulfite exporter TauE/SafE/copper chaperone CopZ|nr:MAG: hypothetical protein CVV47_03700 [Spirochaetae bacterium HGW-Spirochaetae-3]
MGMTCVSCEKRVETAALAVAGVSFAKAEAARNRLTIGLIPAASQEAVVEQVAAAVTAAGYEASSADKARSLPGRDTVLAIAIGTGLAAAFFALDRSGLATFAPGRGATAAALAASGILASFHCVSMCGGIALSQALRAGSATVSRWASLKSSIIYNVGRISGYTAIGALVGSLGSVLDLGPRGRAAVMFIAAAFMAVMGLRLAGLMPAPRRRDGSVLTRIRDAVGSRAAGLGPFAVGLANALMPCGPLQAAQAFALASGSAVGGALAMFAFSAGTVPLMLAFGAGGSLLSRRFRSMAARAGGVLVLFLGVASFGRAWALAGLGIPGSGSPITLAGTAGTVATAAAGPTPSGTPPTGGAAVAAARDGYQEVVFALAPRAYRKIVVAAGVPVKWTIRAAAKDINGCNNAIVVPAYDLVKDLVPGDNVIEFLPDRPGTIQYSCWMGMIRSTIEVVAPDDPRLGPAS